MAVNISINLNNSPNMPLNDAATVSDTSNLKNSNININNASTAINDASNTQSAQNIQDTLYSIKNMLAGDILSGYVSSVNKDNIILQLNNGQSLTARLAGNVDVQQGQSLTFLVNKNINNTIELKPMFSDIQEAMLINKALDAANYPLTETNANIVRELLSLNMPVDMNTLTDMIQNNMKFPDADINTIANLMKLDIPVTEENIIQFEAYKNYEHSITGELGNFSSDLSALIDNIISKGDVQKAAVFLNNTVNTLYNTTDMQNNNLADVQNTATSNNVNAFMNNEQITELNTKLSEAFKENASELIKHIAEGDISNKDILSQISELAKNSDNTAELKNLFDSKEYGMLLKQMVNETMMLTPAQVSENNSIKNFYKKLKMNVDTLSQAAAKEAPESALAKNLNEVKANIDFMNDLNKNMTFVQMPVKFSESAGNSDLYVFTNKKALQNGTDNISALLHLDMDNLGPVDIYVKLAGKNLSTNFCLESEEMLDFVYSRIDILNKRLEALGFNTKFEMKLIEDNNKNIDFVDDFIQKENPPVKISQFVFDAKA